MRGKKHNIFKSRVSRGWPKNLPDHSIDNAVDIFRSEFIAKEFFVNYYKNKQGVNTRDDEGEGRVLIESCLYPALHRHVDDYCTHCSKALSGFMSIASSEDGMAIGILYSLQLRTPAQESEIEQAAKRLGIKL
jgi:hypothetical protein